jgi:tRNA (cytidine/uridine-2'-O-)-methyltransferase
MNDREEVRGEIESGSTVGDSSNERAAATGDLHIVLFEPEIAANVGAIGRTCVAAGATLWLVRPYGFILSDRRLKRAGLDYWDDLKLREVDDLSEIDRELGRDRLWLFSTKGVRVYTSAAYRPGDALVFGPESRGLPRRLLDERPDRVVRIPIRPEARSLNLAVAASVGAFEAIRRISS